jgi:hypothetical protein
MVIASRPASHPHIPKGNKRKQLGLIKEHSHPRPEEKHRIENHRPEEK